MSAPTRFIQEAETAGLSGVGPHDCYPDVPVDAAYTGEIVVSLHVHGTPTKTQFLRAKIRATISLGAIVATEVIGAIYKEAAWALVADPEVTIVGGVVVVTFEGIAAVDAEAGMLVYGERT
jgi:hypothetical protein